MMSQQGDAIWKTVLSRYALSHPRVVSAGGGTAAPKVIVQAGDSKYLLRQRRPRWSAPQVVAYDHGVIGAIAAAGLPSVVPEQTVDGKTWVRVGAAAYELFPFVAGLIPFRQERAAQIASAGETLARFHRATSVAHPPGAKAWRREHDTAVMAPILADAIAGGAGTPERIAMATKMLRSARRLIDLLTPDLVRSLPHVIIHGDYTPANILFRKDAVGGIFDFDWVSWQPRIIDVGEALEFFAFKRLEPIDPDSIWSLVQSWEPDLVGARVFLDSYQSVWPLTDPEKLAIPLFIRETWLGIRVRAMRKVPHEQQLLILTEGALRPLRWLEENGDEMTRC